MANPDLRIFVECTTKTVFDAHLAAGDITTSQIVFIKDTEQIYHNGKYYGLSSADAAKLAAVYARQEFGYVSDGTNTYRSSAAEGTLTITESSETGEVMDVTVGASGVVIKLVAATGSTNGTISLNGTEIAVAGLGSAAYTNSTAYDAAGSAATAKSEVIGASTDAASDNTIYGAKKYADQITVNGQGQTNQAIVIDGGDIELTGYTEAATKGAVAATDSVNAAIGKLEYRLDNLDLGDATTASKNAFLTSTAFTGTPTAPTAAVNTNTTQLATTAFVVAEINDKMVAAQAMQFKGIANSASDLNADALPGWTYRAGTAFTLGSEEVEVGDMIICTAAKTTDPVAAATWGVIQNNIDGAVTGPASSTDAHVAIFDGATGKAIKDSGFTIGQSVPAAGVFDDHKYTFSAGTDGSFNVTENVDGVNASTGTAQKISIGKPATAGTADQVEHTLTVTKGDGTTATFDGSADAAVSILSNDIKMGTTGHAYSKPSSGVLTAITDNDSIQTAIGKLEAMFDWVIYNS